VVMRMPSGTARREKKPVRPGGGSAAAGLLG